MSTNPEALRPASSSLYQMAEADHRIANNLTLLSGLIRCQAKEAHHASWPFTPKQVCMLLEDLASRVETIAKLHKLLAANLDANGVNLVQFVGEICMQLSSILPPGRLSLSMECESGRDIAPQDALSIGLVVAEMLTNAIKYAHPTGVPVRVHVTCRERSRGEIVVEVADDGVGLPEDFDPVTDGGWGFRLMRSLAEQLGGDLEFEQSSLGLRCRLVCAARTEVSESASVAA